MMSFRFESRLKVYAAGGISPSHRSAEPTEDGVFKPFVKKFKVKFWLTPLGAVKMHLV
jgi:hypothetical protein